MLILQFVSIQNTHEPYALVSLDGLTDATTDIGPGVCYRRMFCMRGNLVGMNCKN